MRLTPSALTVLLVPALAAPLWAGAPPAIPAEIWAMKSDPTKVAQGAIFLEARLVLGNYGIEHAYRIRILSEKGKAAAQFPAFGESVHDIEGRTVHPDGRVVPFSSKKDFQAKTVLETATGSVERRVVVPPGVSDDCVVELKWIESYNFIDSAFFAFGRMKEWRLTKPFPIEQYVVEVPKVFAWAWNLTPEKDAQMVKSEARGHEVFTFRNIPAFEAVPYALDSARAASRLVAFPSTQDLNYAAHEGEGPYWDAFIQRYIRPHYDNDVSRGKAFDALAEELTKGLPAQPQALANELMMRLDARVRNLDYPTFLEQAQAKKGEEDRIDDHDLGAAAKRGSARGFGMVLLYFHLLRKAGVQPLLGFVADRELRLLNPKMLNYQQLTDVLVGVEDKEKGAVLWVDPSLRYATPGLYHPNYQGTPGLVVDTSGKAWTCRFRPMAAHGPAFNQRRYTYTMELGDDEDRFHLETRFGGYPEYLERRRYMALDAAEQSRKLKESLERELRQAVLAKAEVRNATNPRENVTWEVDGTLERETSRRRAVDPFPLMHAPLWIPEDLPAERKDSLVLPYLSVQVATCTFKVPKGYRFAGVEPFNHENPFGRVVWMAEAKEADGATTVKAVFRVDVNRLTAPASEYPAFREFLGWIREAMGRQLVLEKL